MPDGARCRTARNPEKREIPKSAKSQTAPNGGPFRSLSLFGIWRRLGFGAVWDFAPFGIWRPSAFRAVSGISANADHLPRGFARPATTPQSTNGTNRFVRRA